MPQIDTATWSCLCWFSVDLTFFSVRPKAHQWASLVAQRVKRLPAMRESWVPPLGWEDPLEKEMTTYSSILAWEIPWTEEPGGHQSMGSQRVGHDWATKHSVRSKFIMSLILKNFFEIVFLYSWHRWSPGLHRLFSGCGGWGLLSSCDSKFPSVVASPCEAWALRHTGCRSGSLRAQWSWLLGSRAQAQ